MQGSGVQFFPVFFVLFWLTITTLLGVLSGWFSLMRRYPDQKDQKPVFTLKAQSGNLGGVRMNGVLRLSACPSGLRIGIIRIFGIFCRDIFVPWSAISIRRKTWYLVRVADMEFGIPVTGRLIIAEHVANRLAQAVPGLWPEAGPLPVETRKTTRRHVFRNWLLRTALASTFFIVVPRLVAPENARPPILVAVLFPAIVFGLVALFQYWNRRQGLK